MENEEYQSYYVSSYYKFLMQQKNAYITNKFHRDDVHDEVYANKIKDIQLNYNINILKESKNYLNKRLLEKLFIQ
jgi:hypothetical protein